MITARVGVFSSSFTIYVEENITRFYGKDRYLTSFAAADAEKALKVSLYGRRDVS